MTLIIILRAHWSGSDLKKLIITDKINRGCTYVYSLNSNSYSGRWQENVFKSPLMHLANHKMRNQTIPLQNWAQRLLDLAKSWELLANPASTDDVVVLCDYNNPHLNRNNVKDILKYCNNYFNLISILTNLNSPAQWQLLVLHKTSSISGIAQETKKWAT